MNRFASLRMLMVGTLFALTAGSVSAATTIPAKIEAESYASMAGVATETTTDTGGGLDVGWIDTGDWMAYAITVPTAGIPVRRPVILLRDLFGNGLLPRSEFLPMRHWRWSSASTLC